MCSPLLLCGLPYSVLLSLFLLCPCAALLCAPGSLLLLLMLLLMLLLLLTPSAAAGNEIELKKGETAYRKGDTGEYFYLVESGAVAKRKDGAEAEPMDKVCCCCP